MTAVRADARYHEVVGATKFQARRLLSLNNLVYLAVRVQKLTLPSVASSPVS